MGKLESWLGRNLGPLKPRFKIAESIKEGLANLKKPTDLADFVKMEGDNRSLRREVGELQAIIESLKHRQEPDDTIRLVKGSGKPYVPPPPYSGVYDLYTPVDKILQADVDEARRKLAATDSMVVQLKTRMEILKTQLATAYALVEKGDNVKALQQLVEASRTSTIGLLPRVPLGASPAFPDNRQAVRFDDAQPQPDSEPKANGEDV